MSKWIRALFNPAKTIPQTSWRSRGGQWEFSPNSFSMLVIGLWIFGSGEAALINAGLGVSPWTVLAEGLASTFKTGVGVATFVVSVLVLLLWIPLKQWPGIGTIMNALVIATAIDLMRLVIPTPSEFRYQLLLVLIGVLAVGLGSAIYLTAQLGPGPRDGLMTGLHYRFGWPVARVRLGIEISVLAFGWLLGGTVGLGTALFAVLIGWSIAINLAVLSKAN